MWNVLSYIVWWAVLISLLGQWKQWDCWIHASSGVKEQSTVEDYCFWIKDGLLPLAFNKYLWLYWGTDTPTHMPLYMCAVSKLVFYAQSAGTIISGRYMRAHTLIYMCAYTHTLMYMNTCAHSDVHACTHTYITEYQIYCKMKREKKKNLHILYIIYILQYYMTTLFTCSGPWWTSCMNVMHTMSTIVSPS